MRFSDSAVRMRDHVHTINERNARTRTTTHRQTDRQTDRGTFTIADLLSNTRFYILPFSLHGHVTSVHCVTTVSFPGEKSASLELRCFPPLSNTSPEEHLKCRSECQHGNNTVIKHVASEPSKQLPSLTEILTLCFSWLSDRTRAVKWAFVSNSTEVKSQIYHITFVLYHRN